MNDEHNISEAGGYRIARLVCLVAPLAVAIGVGAHVADQTGSKPLMACGAWPDDTDGDGLPDAQELVLGTSALLADSDSDGYSDTHEFAAQSDPLDETSIPLVQDVSVGMSARGGDTNTNRLSVAVYAKDGVFDTEVIRFGKVHMGMLVSVPFRWLLTRSLTTEIDVPTGGKLIVVEIDMPFGALANTGAVSYFSAVGLAGEADYQSAAVVDLAWRDGVTLLRVSQASSAPSAQVGGGSIYQPIPGEGVSIPDGWIPGQVCFRTSETVGGTGAVITREVTSAECQEGWDSYCASGCSESVGQTYQTVDPLALVGG